MVKKSSIKLWVTLPVGVFVLFLVNVSLGSVSIPFIETLKAIAGAETSEPVWREIILSFRLPKALTCVLAGASLSLGGLLMQTLFRNPLAGPDVLGLSSGASLAVAITVLAVSSGFNVLPGAISVALAATLGSSFIFLLILAAAQRIKDNTSLLIIGLMVGAAASSIVSVLQFLSRAEDQQHYLIWTFGSLGRLNSQEIQLLSIISIGAGIFTMRLIKPLNAWLIGDNYAQSMGTNIGRTRIQLIIITCLLTGSVTAFCGPIAFVGLAVPHLTRLLINTNNHKILIPGVLLFGAGLMLFCDTMTQLPSSSYILPINAVTALIGAPVVIWIIVRNRKIKIQV